MFIFLSKEERDEVRSYGRNTLLAIVVGSVVLWWFS